MTSSDTKRQIFPLCCIINRFIIQYSKKGLQYTCSQRPVDIQNSKVHLHICTMLFSGKKGDQLKRNLTEPYIKKQTHIGKKNVRVREVIRDLFINGQLIIALLWMIQGINDRPGTFLFTKSTMPNVLCMDRFSSFSFTKHKHCRASFRCDLSSVFGSRTSSSITLSVPNTCRVSSSIQDTYQAIPKNWITSSLPYRCADISSKLMKTVFDELIYLLI